MSVPFQSKRTPSTPCFRFSAIVPQSSRNVVNGDIRNVRDGWRKRLQELVGSGMSARDLRLEKTRRNAVVAVKLDIIECRGDAIPARHRTGLDAAHMRDGSNNHLPEAPGLAYHHNLKLVRSANCQLP